MNASVKGALSQINTSWKAFTHNDKPMTKTQVKAVLEYAVSKGYETTKDIPSNEIETIIKQL